MTIQQAAKLALDVQDACNLSGVVLSFGRILTGPLAHLDTDARNTHPICKLFADKIRSLSRSDDLWHRAYTACEQLAATPPPAPEPGDYHHGR